MTDIEKIVLETFVKAGKSMRPGDVVKNIGIDSKEVSKAIKELKKNGKLHSPKRCLYAPVK